MPITWLNHEFVVQHINGQCIIVLCSKMHDTRRGLEIFVRGIPSDFGPNELVPVFSKVGLIYYIRLLMDYGQCNRGIAYVSYVNSNNAHRALRVLNGLRITVDHNLELFKCRESRIFYICNIMDIFTSYSMSILITQLAHVHNFECKVSRNGNYHEAMLKFPSHRDYIRAYNKVNSSRHIFGIACWIKSSYSGTGAEPGVSQYLQ